MFWFSQKTEAKSGTRYLFFIVIGRQYLVLCCNLDIYENIQFYNLFYKACISIERRRKKQLRSLFQSVPEFSLICVPFSNTFPLQRHLAPTFKTTLNPGRGAFNNYFLNPLLTRGKKLKTSSRYQLEREEDRQRVFAECRN